MKKTVQKHTPEHSDPDTGFAVTADVRTELEHLILEGLTFILERQRPEYPFIDTKLDIITGKNFAADDPVRGPAVIYSWIQGRGLEALAEHGHWLHSLTAVEPKRVSKLVDSIGTVLQYTVSSMEAARKNNGGRLPFMMDAKGNGMRVVFCNNKTVCVDVVSAPPLPQAHSLSDLFYAKGLMSAASFLRSARLAKTAEALFLNVIEDLKSGRFYFGQEQLDPKNPVTEMPQRLSHAGRMIAIGAATTFWRHTSKEFYRDLGIEFIHWILEKHTSRAADARTDFLEGDFWEFTFPDFSPWHTDSGQIWSDPGHATEFVGLAFAHLEKTASSVDPLLKRSLFSVLLRNFSNGFSEQEIGIVKSFDLVKRVPINTDMPWWSLPETMRAAALAASDAIRQNDDQSYHQAQSIFNQCWRSFRKHYVRPEQGSLAAQCLGYDGTVSKAIPAAPDADPCYHTGLSLIDCLRRIS